MPPELAMRFLSRSWRSMILTLLKPKRRLHRRDRLLLLLVMCCLFCFLLQTKFSPTKLIVDRSEAFAQIQSEEPLTEAEQFNEECLQLINRRQLRDALAVCQRAIETARAENNQAVEAASLNDLGTIHRLLGQYPQAIQYYQQSLEILQAVGYRTGEATLLMNLGNAYGSLGQHPQAIQRYQQSLEIQRAIDDRAGEARSLNNLGSVYRAMGQYSQAIEQFQQSLEILQAIGDQAGAANPIGNLGSVYYALGQYPQAIEKFQQSLEILQAIGDRAGEAGILSNIGNVYQSIGQYSQAIQQFQQSLKIQQDIDDRYGVATSLNNLGNVYWLLGQYPQAIEQYEQSLEIQQAIGNQAGVALSLNNLGDIYRVLGQYPKAIEQLEQALKIQQAVGSLDGEALALNNLGNVYTELGQGSRAIEHYQQSLKIQRAIDDRDGEALSLHNLGYAYMLLGQYSSAIEYYQQALEIQQTIGDRAGEARSLSNLGYAFFRTNQLTEAETSSRQSIESFETLRLDLSDADKLSLFETLRNPYYNLQEILIAQGQSQAITALEIAERSRARAFVELLQQRLAPIAAQDLAASQVASPITLEQIKQVARDQQSTLVEYSLADAKLHIWVVSPTGNIAFRSVDLQDLESSLSDLALNTNSAVGAVRNRSLYIPDSALSLLVRGTREQLNLMSDGIRSNATRETPEDPVSVAPLPHRQQFTDGLSQLYDRLIQPIADLLPTDPNEQIVFIPHGYLFLVPFPALQAADSSYLIQHHTIRISPAIQVLKLTDQQPRQSGREPLIIGNPTNDLPASAQEAEAVAQLLNTHALIGDEATKAVVMERMPQASLIHLAAHAAPNAIDQSYGGFIELAADEGNNLLTTNEILQMQLQAELVVLSGCNTGVSEIVNSDGVVGLFRSLITAGTPSVLASLWQVDDIATASLMTDFYRHWQPQSHRSSPVSQSNKAQALRQAMLSIMQQYPEPRMWAAFTLVGEAD